MTSSSRVNRTEETEVPDEETIVPVGTLIQEQT